MEDKLRVLVTKIETSPLLDSDKEQLYALISRGLQMTVLPVLLKYIDQTKLKDLSNNPDKVTVDAYIELITEAVKDGKALLEINSTMEGLLDEIGEALIKAGVK